MGAAVPPPVHRRKPATVSAQFNLVTSIFFWFVPPLVPLLDLHPHLYILRLHDHGVEVWLAPSQASLVAAEGVRGAIGDEEVVVCAEGGKAVSWHC